MSEPNSLCFPCLEKVRTKFPVFPVPWPPCLDIEKSLLPYNADRSTCFGRYQQQLNPINHQTIIESSLDITSTRTLIKNLCNKLFPVTKFYQLTRVLSARTKVRLGQYANERQVCSRGGGVAHVIGVADPEGIFNCDENIAHLAK